MKGISRRARACAVVAATGVAVLAGATAANAQRPAKAGDGIPTGQMSTQMFNYGGYLNNGAQHRRREPGHRRRPPPACTSTAHHAGAAAGAPRGRCSRSSSARASRSIELFGHSGFPAQNDIPGLIAYRALLDKYGLHAAGWHGTVNDVGPAWTERVAAAKILGADYIGSGGLASPGIGTYADTLRTAEALNRLGKELRRGRRRPRLHPQSHRRVRRQVRRQRRAQDGLADHHGAHRPALRERRARRLLVLGRLQRRHGRRRAPR